MGQVHWSSTIGVDKYYSGHQSSFQKHFHTAWAVAWQLTTIWHNAICKGLVAKTEWSAQKQHLYSRGCIYWHKRIAEQRITSYTIYCWFCFTRPQ